MDRSDTPVPSLVAGRSTPAPGRPPQLDDPVWLRRAYERDGDMRIALDLGVNRKTVRMARYRLGIQSQPPGRRRGVTAPASAPVVALDPSCQLIADRAATWRRQRVPATETTLRAAIHAAYEALARGETNAADDALIDVATAAALFREHRQKLRRAA